MLVKSGQEFCGEHQKPITNMQTSDNSLKIRIVCPLDPKHTVFAQNLKKHLTICNAREKPQEEFIEKNVNSGHLEVTPEFPSNDSFQMLSTFSKEQILNVIKKVDHIYEEKVTITTKHLSFKIVEDETNKPENGNKAKKHLKQESSILGMLQGYNLLKDKTCFIEFGAGRGQLSYWIAKATTSLEGCKLLLIEKASPKHKRDNKLARTCDTIMRIRADIADLVLDKVAGVNEAEHVVGVTKHLCGGATDLAIRCLTGPNINKHKISGIILTFCCHHRCSWTSYIGKKFFEENQLDITEFHLICGLTSWATCGTGFSREYREKLKNGELEGSLMETEKYGLNRAKREEIGRKCKNIINWGRLRYLQEFGFECSLHYYVDKEITLENVCIVAQRVPNKHI
ncbi:tRNA:m(4)X modification enzyme TRM13 homolog isoform X2 [Euwallacea fornicatus]